MRDAMAPFYLSRAVRGIGSDCAPAAVGFIEGIILKHKKFDSCNLFLRRGVSRNFVVVSTASARQRRATGVAGRDLRFRLPTEGRSVMKCPTCPESVLVMTDRSGIEIDYCPTCRGVWLDRGELDKIIERAAGATASVTAVAAPTQVYAPPPSRDVPRPDTRGWKPDDDDDDNDRRKYSSDGYKPKKKKSILGELFDF